MKNNKIANIKCDVCGKEFYKYYIGKHNFCSEECRKKWRLGRRKNLDVGLNIDDLKYKETTNTKCNFCNKEFYKKKDRITDLNFCSRDCYKQWVEKNLKKKFICEICNKEYYKRGKKTIHHFCSVECYNEWVDKSRHKVKCEECNKEFYKRKRECGNHIFCSNDCFLLWKFRNKKSIETIRYQKAKHSMEYRENIKSIQRSDIDENYKEDYLKIVEYVNNNLEDILNQLNDIDTIKDERRKKYNKDYNDGNKEYMKELKKNERMEVIYWYSNGAMKCNICGENHLEFLEIDHLNNDGNKHKKENSIGSNLVWWIIRNDFPEMFQILCSNCNVKKWKIINASKRDTKRKISVYETKDKIKMKIFKHYGGDNPECECCHENDIEKLTIDHIKGNGADHRRELGNSGYFYKDIIKNKYPDDYRILCQNCNASIGRHGYCPHNIIKTSI